MQTFIAFCLSSVVGAVIRAFHDAYERHLPFHSEILSPRGRAVGDVRFAQREGRRQLICARRRFAWSI
jgi:hypothetical protein